MENKGKLVLTVDVEEWFQVENLKEAVNYNDWNLYEKRIKSNIEKFLFLMEKYGIKGTFFILGWVAESHPEIVKLIHKEGHEISSHGYGHELIHNLSQGEFRKDATKSKKIIEEIIGQNILGFRAPSFSINNWAIDMLKEIGYLYDSSYCPTSIHNRYGKLTFNVDHEKYTKNGIFQYPNGLIEVPLPTLNLMKVSIPWGGGAYFRLMPYSIFKLGMKKIVNKNKLFTFYFHSWEVDNNQPCIKNIKLNYKIRHYTGLKKSYMKLERLLKDFSFTSIRDYLKRLNLLPANY